MSQLHFFLLQNYAFAFLQIYRSINNINNKYIQIELNPTATQKSVQITAIH